MPDRRKGRDLDRAVAVALGWRNVHLSRVTGPVGDYFGIPPGGDRNFIIPRFESEFGAYTQDALDWLAKRGEVSIIVFAQDEIRGVRATLLNDGENIETEAGPTTCNALARLVVAVAEAEGGGDGIR